MVTRGILGEQLSETRTEYLVPVCELLRGGDGFGRQGEMMDRECNRDFATATRMFGRVHDKLSSL